MAARRLPSGVQALVLAGTLLATLVGAGVVVLLPDARDPARTSARSCPVGYRPVELERLREEFAFSRPERHESEGHGIEAGAEGRVACISEKHPEPFIEIEARQRERLMKATAPDPQAPSGAMRRSLEQRNALIAVQPAIPGSAGQWRPYGTGPLLADEYPSTEGFGFVELNGRVDSLDYDPASGRLFALIGTGGVWMSDDLGRSWRSIGDKLPTQINGALAWTPARSGTLVVVSGEHLQGGNTYTGLGAFWTGDLGKTWHQASGVPDDALGFQVAVDPTNPAEVYVATSKGLFRSTDAGRTYVNANLPTGDCAGVTDPSSGCLLANFVTDVVVQSPDGFGNGGGTVVAAVGYRAGQRPYPQDPDTVESCCNGLYRSETGAPDSFERLEAPGLPPRQRIGRVELGTTDGPAQNHDYLYAIVQDAVLFQGGPPTIDQPEIRGVPAPTVLNGVYVSPDFGTTWRKMGDTATIAFNPLTGSALTSVSALFAPGVQAWYNMFVKVDPTRQTANGVPTRITFGLEEVFENRFTNQPQDGPSDFRVIGRYFATETCIVFVRGVPTCPPDNPLFPTTTHPDQHDALYVPDGRGGVTLVVGNDGGVYTQHVGHGEEFDNQSWGVGANRGFNTLLPYDASMAKDGTVWYGLQDNGTGKIEPDGQQFMTFGGDGLFTAVAPDDSDIAYGETPNARIRVTTDGGRTWRDMRPFITGTMFSTQFVMDPTDARHLMTGGHQIAETTFGPDTQQMDPSGVVCVANCWQRVFDLGTDEDGERRQMSAVDLQGDFAYAGWCAVCDIINGGQFDSGIATNVGGAAPPRRMTSSGWHIAAAEGLPDRFITSVAIDPSDPTGRTVYASLGGYSNRQWRPPGSFGDDNPNIGTGHVFKSTDGGETFTDISGTLPDAPAYWVEKRPGTDQLVVGTEIGVFLSSDTSGGPWVALNAGMPVVPIATLEFSPARPDMLIAATYGRGVYLYRFRDP